MIQIEKIEISEFRGIRNLSFEPKRSSFAICGPNGTGKSGIVDAIEFCFTGVISRLKGEGTDGIKLKQHGPHVDSAKNPDLAVVSIDIYIPHLNKKAQIVRKISAPTSPVITPNDADIISVLKKIEDHPEFTLTRREIIKYILQPSAKRGEQVRSLLKLKKIEDIRKLFQTISNSCKKIREQTQRELDNAISMLITAIGDKFSEKSLIDSVNQHRNTIGLLPIQSLDETFGMIENGLNQKTPQLAKNTILQAIESFSEKSNIFINEHNAIVSIIKDLQQLKSNTDSVSRVSRAQLYNLALAEFDGEKCPVCDYGWDDGAFRSKINLKLQEISSVNKQINDARKSISEIRKKITDVTSHYEQISVYFEKDDKLSVLSLDTAVKEIKEQNSIFIETDDIDKTILSLNKLLSFTAQALIPLKQFREKIERIPDQTKQVEATNTLATLTQRYAFYKEKTLELDKAKQKELVAEKIYKKYDAVADSTLEEIYSKVRDNFIAYYRTIHKSDEEAFTADLLPSSGGLELLVDFYTRGKFPPAAYHSEGHQDGMGLCLYLALMNYIFGDNFTFAVFDDVLMSVDNEHRRHVSKLLNDFFPKTQFIITTHDKIWLRLMEGHRLIKPNQSLRFRSWTVENGPCDWSQLDVWGEIFELLGGNETIKASATLRNYLEFISIELCNNFNAKVHFRADSQYSIGELMPAAYKAFVELLDEGIKSAKKWNNNEMEKFAADFKTNFQLKFKDSRVEDWSINPTVHYNEWDNFHKDDLLVVAQSHKELIQQFYCPDCGHLIDIGYDDKRRKKEISCKCSKIRINLQ